MVVVRPYECHGRDDTVLAIGFSCCVSLGMYVLGRCIIGKLHRKRRILVKKSKTVLKKSSILRKFWSYYRSATDAFCRRRDEKRQIQQSLLEKQLPTHHKEAAHESKTSSKDFLQEDSLSKGDRTEQDAPDVPIIGHRVLRDRKKPDAVKEVKPLKKVRLPDQRRKTRKTCKSEHPRKRSLSSRGERKERSCQEDAKPPCPKQRKVQEPSNILTPEEKTILTSRGGNGFLDDEIIRKAQELLKHQFEKSDGLQPTAALLVPGYYVEKEAVQIHYDSERIHWLTSCYRNGHILLADSMKTANLSPSIRQQISNVYGQVVPDPLRHVKILNVDQQPNGYDCGVFAIANAYEFLSGNINVTTKYQHKEMRKHLMSCFKRGEIKEFPKKSNEMVK